MLTTSRSSCECLISQLILRATCLCWLWLPCWSSGGRLSGCLFKSLSVFHPDFLPCDTIFGLLLVFAIAEAERVIVAFTDRAGINGRQRLPFALLPRWCIPRSWEFGGCPVEIYIFWRTILECNLATVRRFRDLRSWFEKIWIGKRTSRATGLIF